MDSNNIIACDGFFFIHNFDSGNLGHVESVPTERIAPGVNNKNIPETPDYEFNLWTRPDCAGTEFENGNRTWFYFGIQGGQPCVLVRLNLMNLNKQGKMYNQGMAPVTRTLPGKPQWERIRDRPVHCTDENTFTLSFKYRTPENLKATTFFAFTYPFSFAELQIALNSIDLKFLPLGLPHSLDEIYYCRECLVHSLEGRRVDLITISSYHGITHERETKLKHLFPENEERPFKFHSKKIIFISARVHPGETPSSFVFNGFLNLLLTRNDPIAIMLRKLYVFKMVPFLNPDGVARGHYRTDTRGVNLNRVYLNPSLQLHPTVFAARALIRYHHFGYERDETLDDKNLPLYNETSRSTISICESEPIINTKRKKIISKGETKKVPSPKVTNSTQHSPNRKETMTGDTATLADQVLDLKLAEMTNENKSCSTSNDTNSLLNETNLQNCLGSEVHVIRSAELKIPGSNPLRHLRETLKDSISLLMKNASSEISNLKPESSGVRVSWCKQCREAFPGSDCMSPSISIADPCCQDVFQEIGDEIKSKVILCSNCFKKFMIGPNDEEIVVSEERNNVSVGISAGNNDEASRPVTTDSDEAEACDSNGDTPVIKDPSGPLQKAPPKLRKKLPPNTSFKKEPDSGLFLYVDLHGHASKKGIFMYGNHFEELENSVECMLLPRIMSLNNLHFHFASCNFTEKNMYLKDRRDGMSREGSGRVAVLKATGLVRSYTLECNYNTGRLVNVLPPTVRDGPSTTVHVPTSSAPPPKYTPHIFEEVGRSLGASILDLTGSHPNSRIPGSEHRNLTTLRDWLRAHSRAVRPMQLTMSRLRSKVASPSNPPLFPIPKSSKLPDIDRKENTYIPKTDRTCPLARPGRSTEVLRLKKDIPKSFTRPKYFTEPENSTKKISTKRRNVLAIRKPNVGKSRSNVALTKSKSHRKVDEPETKKVTKIKKSKGRFSALLRREGSIHPENARTLKQLPSCSSTEALGGWEDVTSGTVLNNETIKGKRRPFANAPTSLKKIRLKTHSAS